MMQFSHNEADTISRICQDVYSGISSPDMWNQTLASIQCITDIDALGIVFYDPKSGKPVNNTLIDINPDVYRKYEEQYVDTDPFSLVAMASGINVFTPSDILGEENWKKSVYYSDFLLPAGDPELLLAECGTPSRLLVQLGLVKKSIHRQFTEKDKECMKILQPHLALAYKRQMLLNDIKRSKDSFISIIDQLNKPIVILDADFTPLHLNSAFKNLVSANRSLHDTMKTLGESARNIIISTAMNGDCLSYAGNEIIALDEVKFKMMINRIEPSDAPVYYIAELEELTSHLSQIIDISAHKYRLSAREIEICTMIMKGLSNHEIAEALYLSEYTVKDHLKNILEKLQVTSRSKALAKLFGSL